MGGILSSPDLATILVNVAVGICAVVASVLGLYRGLRSLKRIDRDIERDSPARVLGGTIMENQTLLMWSESNRSVTEALQSNTRAYYEHMREMIEMRHAMDRLASKL